ncbi:hypothetical protein J2128_000410 [Methanomicrobium sp. W14]|uniref:PP2C family serine/threonine-protein phosphatase n=1 Tax=Methanomicrobium sp. W14 TaxID=2817839 RepID=UPI001AE32A8C|nr:PP2C family serine/threonine-protein phosphatase [Methanomicrobium sp. W14]MBP2132489.1 hypothetical protein [Methanomicrobium sp. W14]
MNKLSMNISISGAKTTGASHIKKGLSCQDAWTSEIPREDSAAIAVADGLGSARYSEKGAEIAVRTATESIKKHFMTVYDENITSADITSNVSIIEEAFLSSVSAIEKYSIENKVPKKELACTLIVILVYKKSVSIGQVGDGGVVGQSYSGKIKLLSEPAESEYINEVTPVTSDKWRESLRISQNIPDIKNIAAFTDGCQRAVLIKENDFYKPYVPFFRPFFEYAEKSHDKKELSDDIGEFLLSGKINEVSDDDKTLVAISLGNNQKKRN